VEAMKLFNQIKAPYDCKIVKFMSKHGDPVQKDQPLLAVRRAESNGCRISGIHSATSFQPIGCRLRQELLQPESPGRRREVGV